MSHRTTVVEASADPVPSSIFFAILVHILASSQVYLMCKGYLLQRRHMPVTAYAFSSGLINML